MARRQSTQGDIFMTYIIICEWLEFQLTWIIQFISLTIVFIMTTMINIHSSLSLKLSVLDKILLVSAVDELDINLFIISL